MKKWLTIFLSVSLVLLCFSACGQAAPVSSGLADDTPSAAVADEQSPYAHLDLSKEANVVMYACATEPNAMQEVLELVNQRTKEAVNTTLELYFIPSSERAQKYPLLMAGGDTVELIFTANYCY